MASNWFFQCAAGALAVVLASGLATAWFGTGLQLPSTTTRDGAVTAMNRYVSGPIPDVVLVGSSLTYRLSESYFSKSKVRNLALAGGSPVTGLEIVNARAELPKIVLIEANVLSRPVDEELVRKFSAGKIGVSWFFRPIRFAVAVYENWLHAPPSHAQINAEITRVTEAPPAEFDNRIYLARALEQANAENPEQATRKNVVALKRLISNLNQGNSRALLFEIPYPEELENSTFASVTRDIVHTAFPDPSSWITIGLARKELRWNDGSHLDERSAMLVASALEQALSSIGVDTTVPFR